MSDQPLHRLPLRQLLASSDKTTRELAELVYTHFIPRVSDFRDLTRPVNARRVLPELDHRIAHRRHHFRGRAGRRVVVEIDHA